MTPDTFFDKFDELADAPDAVSRMRELVLDMGATGRLIPTEGEWPSRPLKSLATKIGSGATPNGGRDSYFSEGIPLIRSMNVHFRGFDKKGLVFLDDEQARQLSNVSVQRDDVLLNITGASIGRVTTAPAEMEGARVNQHVTIIRPNAEILPAFLSMFLASPRVQRMIDEVQVGATRQALTKGMIEQFQIPLPNLAEQKRIIAKVDELMALCDRLQEQQQEREMRTAELARASLSRFADAPTTANLNFLFHASYDIAPADLRKMILSLAVQGRLVTQDPADIPAEVAFPKLGLARVSPGEDMFPAHWMRVPLGAVGEWRGGGTPSKARSDFWNGDIPWVSPKDMKLLRIADAQDHISEAAVEDSSVRMVPAGSLLMVVRGMILARAFPVALTTKDVTINQDMKAVVPVETGLQDYVLLALRAVEPNILSAVERSSHGTCRLETEYLHQLIIAIPPADEQRRIVAKVEELMALVDQLEALVSNSRQVGTKLLEAVVAELVA